MVIAIFGESCVGKSTLADALKARYGATVYSGKDYLRLAKSEVEAKRKFSELLSGAEGTTIYVVSELDQLSLLPEKCVRVLMTADIETIRDRFAKRMNGKLPPPVAAMLEKKHGMFGAVSHGMHLEDGKYDLENACAEIAQMAK